MQLWDLQSLLRLHLPSQGRFSSPQRGTFGCVTVPRTGKGEPIIPPKFVGALARTNYLLLLCPLYYSAIGKAVTPSVLAGLWPVVVGFFAIILVGAAFSTALSFLPCFRFLRRMNRRVSFKGLRVVAALSNAVSLPLLVFPSLCEYDVVHEAFSDPESSSFEEMIRECTDNANVMIFLCQFAFCVYLFCMGQQEAGTRPHLRPRTPLTSPPTLLLPTSSMIRPNS
jgi:hypothetical protein